MQRKFYIWLRKLKVFWKCCNAHKVKRAPVPLTVPLFCQLLSSGGGRGEGSVTGWVCAWVCVSSVFRSCSFIALLYLSVDFLHSVVTVICHELNYEMIKKWIGSKPLSIDQSGRKTLMMIQTIKPLLFGWLKEINVFSHLSAVLPLQ